MVVSQEVRFLITALVAWKLTQIFHAMNVRVMVVGNYHWSCCRLFVKSIFSAFLEKLKIVFPLLSLSISIHLLAVFSLILLGVFRTPHKRHQIVILFLLESWQVNGFPSLFVGALVEKRSDLAVFGFRVEMAGTEVFSHIVSRDHHALGWIVWRKRRGFCGFFGLLKTFLLEGRIDFPGHTI